MEADWLCRVVYPPKVMYLTVKGKTVAVGSNGQNGITWINTHDRMSLCPVEVYTTALGCRFEWSVFSENFFSPCWFFLNTDSICEVI